MSNHPPLKPGWSGSDVPSSILGAPGLAADPQWEIHTAYYVEGGVAKGNRYTSFGAAHAALLAVGDVGRLVVDASIAPCVTGGANHDMTGIYLAAAAPNTELTIEDGCTLPNLYYIDDWLTVTVDASAPPIVITAGLIPFYNGFGCKVQSNAGKAPLIEVSGAAILIFIGRQSADVVDNGAAVIELKDTAQLRMTVGPGGTLDSNTLKNAAGTAIKLYHGAVSAEISTTHANVTPGTLTVPYDKGDQAAAAGVNVSAMTGILAGLSPTHAQAALAAIDPHQHGGGTDGLAVAHADTSGKTENDHHNRQHPIGSASDHTASAIAAWDALLTGDSFEILSRKGVALGYASLDAAGRVPASQMPLSALEYKGAYAASTDTPALLDATGQQGDVWIASDGGTNDYGSGNITLAAGDWLIHNGSIYQKVDASDAVSSVFGRLGAVVAAAGDYTAPQVNYTPTTGADWPDPDPTTVGGGLDDLAALVAANTANRGKLVDQDSYIETADLTDTSTSYTPMATYNYTKLDAANKLEVYAIATARNTAIAVRPFLRLSVGGVVQQERVVARNTAVVEQPCVLVAPERTGDAAGTVAILLEWKSASGTIRCSAASNPEEGLTFVIKEIAP